MDRRGPNPTGKRGQARRGIRDWFPQGMTPQPVQGRGEVYREAVSRRERAGFVQETASNLGCLGYKCDQEGHTGTWK